MPKAKYLIGCLIITAGLLSCTKSKSYDVKGDPEVKFFTNNESAGNAPENSISYSVTNIPNVAGSGWVNLTTSIPDVIKFPVFATKPVSDDVEIGAELDNTLIEKYNTAHNTNYAALPNGLLNTSNLFARLIKGTTTSGDSIAIAADLANVGLLTEDAYMAPIKLTTVSKPDVGAITTNSSTQVAYIVINVETRIIKYNAVAADALGSLITSRSAWTVTLTPDPIQVGNILDGSNATYSRWGVSQGQVDVNMQAAQNVTGIRLYTSSSSTYIPAQVNVYLSNDGINYDYIGSPLKANLTFASSYNYILFYKAVQAKYIRLMINYSTSTSSNNRRLAELDVYAN